MNFRKLKKWLRDYLTTTDREKIILDVWSVLVILALLACIIVSVIKVASFNH